MSFRKKKREWLPSLSEVNTWRNKLSREVKDGLVLKELTKYLSNSTLYIGHNTFSSGFIQCLHHAILLDSYPFVHYMLTNYSKKLNLNEPTLFHPKKSYDLINDPTQLALHCKETLLHAAVATESVQIMKLLLSNKSVSINAINCCSKTPLMLAIEKHKRISVDMLLEHKPDVTCQDKNGKTALMYAVKVPSMVPVIPQLLKLGADVMATDAHGNTALHIAISEGLPGAVYKLLQTKFVYVSSSHAVPYPLYLADQRNFAQGDFIHCEQMNELIEMFLLLKLSVNCVRNLYVLKASWHWVVFLRTSDKFQFTHCYNYLHKAFKATLKTDETNTIQSVELLKEYGIKKPLQSTEDLNEIYSSESLNTNIALSRHCLFFRETIQGYGHPSVIYSLLITAKWFIDIPSALWQEEGLKLWLRGSEMILYHVKVNPPNTFYILRTALNMVINTKRIVTIEKHPIMRAYRKAPQIVSMGPLCQEYLTPIVSTLIECVCECIQIAKERHSHLISQKSFIAGVHLILEILDLFLEYNSSPYYLGIDVEAIVTHLVEKCPKVIIDSNGYPNTLVHILLQFQSIKSESIEILLGMILENNGQWMVNGVGPLGMRPLHLTHKESIISMLLENGAHLDAVNCSKLTVMKDIHVRRPDVFSEYSLVYPLKCLSAKVIAQCEMPYSELTCIPPRLKEFISLHDHNAQDKIMKRELYLDYL